ncbi:hypothetical protein HDU79_011181 [Rhizoclosmatium sp. JEL0117]|nr:hypothetical protein HDU79_011181 [Rhizoclosmatium sp. JEL0117]
MLEAELARQKSSHGAVGKMEVAALSLSPKMKRNSSSSTANLPSAYEESKSSDDLAIFQSSAVEDSCTSQVNGLISRRDSAHKKQTEVVNTIVSVPQLLAQTSFMVAGAMTPIPPQFRQAGVIDSNEALDNGDGYNLTSLNHGSFSNSNDAQTAPQEASIEQNEELNLITELITVREPPDDSGIPPFASRPLPLRSALSAKKLQHFPALEAVSYEEQLERDRKSVSFGQEIVKDVFTPIKPQPQKRVVDKNQVVPTVARALMKRVAMERKMWKYSGMTDEKRLAIFESQLRVQQFLEKTKYLTRKPVTQKTSPEEIEETRKKVVELFVPIPKKPVIDNTPSNEKYVASIPPDDVADEAELPLYQLRGQFVRDFSILEERAMQEYRNYWDMRVRDMDVIPKFILKPYTLDETCSMAWHSYQYLRALQKPVFDYELAKRLLIIIETDWTTQDKLFELQKLIAKLPKTTFLVLKSTLTHLCRISVVQKLDSHMFRQVSNAFAPILFRITSRQNSVQKEEEYLSENPSNVFFPSQDSLNNIGDDFEQDNSYDSLSNWKDDSQSTILLPPISNPDQDVLETQAIEAATNAIADIASAAAAEPSKPSPSTQSIKTTRSNNTNRTHKKTYYARSIISSIHTGMGSIAPEIENLWGDVGGTPPSLHNSVVSSRIKGFRQSQPTLLDKRVSLPARVIAPAMSSPFSQASLRDSILARKAQEEEEEFEAWVKKQMGEVARVFRERKYGVSQVQPVVPPSPPRLEPETGGEEEERENEGEGMESLRLPSPQIVASLPQLGMGSEFSSTTSLEFAGIKIGVTNTSAAEYYMAQSIRDADVAAIEVGGLLAVLETDEPKTREVTPNPNATLQIKKEEDDAEPVVDRISKVKFQSPPPPPPPVPAVLDFGKGDPDGFGWNWTTKKSLARKLLLEQECQTAIAGLLELILKNLDVLFDWNMYISSEQARKELHASNI